MTRRAGLSGEEGVRWESAGEGGLQRPSRPTSPRGERTWSCTYARGRDDLLSSSKLREMLRKYSDHISVPILVAKTTWDATVPRGSPDGGRGTDQPGLRVVGAAQVGDLRRAVPRVSTSTSRTTSSRHWPTATRRWRAAKSTPSCCFIPQRAPYDLWDRDHRHGIKLYVRRVFHHGRRRAIAGRCCMNTLWGWGRTTVWGIGEWTTQMFSHLQAWSTRRDCLAATSGFQEGLRVLDGLDERPTPEFLMTRSEVWRPLRSVAAWFLWRLMDKQLTCLPFFRTS